jgi:SAM-dependent methyltransferase
MAKWYDFDYERRMRHDLRFYEACAEEGGGPVLELGAGTGRVTGRLAKAGFDVTAVDLSEEMLARAEKRRARLGAAGERIRLVHGDMADLKVRGRFGTVIVPFHSFHHLYTVERQLSALRGIRRRLTDRGIAVFDLFRPDIPDFQAGDGKLLVAYERKRPETGTRVVQRYRMTCDFPRQMGTIDYYWDEYRGKRKIGRDHAPMRWRWFHRFEFEHLLARAGLRPFRLLGDYDGRAFSGTCDQMLFFAMRD